MKKILLLLLATFSVQAEDFVTLSGKVKTFNIGTYKQTDGVSTLDANAFSIGGQFELQTKKMAGISAHVNYMTSNGFLLSTNPDKIDGSILANDIKAVSGIAADKDRSIHQLGEVYVAYETANILTKIGRQKYDSPLAAQKEVRMVPSTFSGATFEYDLNGHVFNFAYFDSFKQRTSDTFYNILEHALGANTESFTGKSKGEMLVASMTVNEKAKIYNYHVSDFINSTYVDYLNDDSDIRWAVQAIYQTSVGFFNTALENGTTSMGTYSNGVSVFSAGVKTMMKAGNNDFMLAFTNTANNANAYSNIIAPYDGTPLFTDTITGNNLFKSLYGGAMSADSGYVAGTRAMKVQVKHTLNKELKAVFAVAGFDRSVNTIQTDINAVLSYNKDALSVAIKAILVYNNSQVQNSDLQQYRVIAAYKF